MPGKLTRSSITVCILLVSIALPGCRAGEKSKREQVAFEALIKSELGAKYSVAYNVSKTFALCRQETDGDHVRRKFKYTVIRLKNNSIAHRGSYSMGYVKWLDDKSIEVLNASIREGDSGGVKTVIPINAEQL